MKSEITRADMDFRLVLAILLLSVAAVKAQGGVTFWGEEVTLTCPAPGTWHTSTNNSRVKNESVEFTMIYAGNPDLYCAYNDGNNPTNYYFYVQGKACATCYEVDARLFLTAIVVDLLGTIGLMLFIYSCTKKRRETGPAHTAKSPARSGGQGPPVPSPDYERLNLHTRSQDEYSVVNRK